MATTNPGPHISAALPRRAVPSDARAISQLYHRAYTTDQCEAKDQYPFPQVLELAWVAEAVAGDSIVWVVAELGGVLVGTAATMRNIGGRRDRISEVFGVVVSAEARRRGVATTLLRFLCAELVGETEFILCESRTAEPGGWKIARNCEFIPVGFEPFAHAMPVGFESMILTAKPSGGAVPSTIVAPRLTQASLSLARAVAGNDTWPWLDGAEVLAPDPAGRSTPFSSGAAPAGLLEVRRGDEPGRQNLGGEGGDLDHSSGVICLRPLEGEDRERHRYERPYFVGILDGRAVGCARVVWDWTDRRARILGLRVERDGLQDAMLAGVTQELLGMAGDGPIVIVVNVRADAPDLQCSLERLHFFPTSYYPALIAAGSGRCDAIQYTRLHRRRIEEGLEFVNDIPWARASSVINQVVLEGHTGPRRDGEH